MTPQQANWNRMQEISNESQWTATLCAELCQLNQQAKDNNWQDNLIFGCELYNAKCTAYGSCAACVD